MASNTENLNLLMKNPSTDGADTFNVQTMLNENWQKIDNNAGTVAQTLANILKPTTPPIIGLPPSTTPDGMFQALGNTGELHVWRKTVTTAQEIPAGYTLGSVQTNVEVFSGGGRNQSVLYYDDSPNVDDAGNVTIPNKGGNNQYAFYANSNFNVAYYMRGKYIQIYPGGGYTAIDGVWFVPSDATVTVSNYKINVSKIQKVTGYAKVPAGTTTTYPVSTNPNAYQEGDDVKEAGYTLGEVVSGSFYMGIPGNSYQNTYTYSSSLSVSGDGTVSLANPSTTTSSQWSPLSTDAINSTLVGKFVQWTCQDPNNLDTKYPFNASPSPIIFIPSDAKITVTTPDSNERFTLSKYQPVTGYAAIPAVTTIEYLGKLGDKARVQVVSYVGTGIYGSSNPNSVTANFPIKLLAVVAKALKNSNGNFTTRIDFDNQHREDPFMIGAALTTDYTLGSGCGYKENVYNTSYGKKSNDGKTFSWYTTGNNAARQFNESGYTYTVLLIG